MDDVTAKLAEALREVMADADGYEKRSGKKLVGDWPNKAREALAAFEQAKNVSITNPAEPVGEVVEMDDGCRVVVWRDGTPEPGTKLFAAPVAQADPLTVKQLSGLWSANFIEFARAIEAAHGIGAKESNK